MKIKHTPLINDSRYAIAGSTVYFLQENKQQLTVAKKIAQEELMFHYKQSKNEISKFIKSIPEKLDIPLIEKHPEKKLIFTIGKNETDRVLELLYPILPSNLFDHLPDASNIHSIKIETKEVPQITKDFSIKLLSELDILKRSLGKICVINITLFCYLYSQIFFSSPTKKLDKSISLKDALHAFAIQYQLRFKKNASITLATPKLITEK